MLIYKLIVQLQLEQLVYRTILNNKDIQWEKKTNLAIDRHALLITMSKPNREIYGLHGFVLVERIIIWK